MSGLQQTEAGATVTPDYAQQAQAIVHAWLHTRWNNAADIKHSALEEAIAKALRTVAAQALEQGIKTLLRYTVHLDTCPQNMSLPTVDLNALCTCGLAAALMGDGVG